MRSPSTRPRGDASARCSSRRTRSKPASALAETIASRAPITLWVTKDAVRRIQAARAVPHGDDLVGRTYGSADLHEGVRAFVVQRPPRWTGR